LGFFGARLAPLSQTIIQVQFNRSIISQNQFKISTPMIKRNPLRQTNTPAKNQKKYSTFK